jgi:hypothetical protein
MTLSYESLGSDGNYVSAENAAVSRRNASSVQISPRPKSIWERLADFFDSPTVKWLLSATGGIALLGLAYGQAKGRLNMRQDERDAAQARRSELLRQGPQR